MEPGFKPHLQSQALGSSVIPKGDCTFRTTSGTSPGQDDVNMKHTFPLMHGWVLIICVRCCNQGWFQRRLLFCIKLINGVLRFWAHASSFQQVFLKLQSTHRMVYSWSFQWPDRHLFPEIPPCLQNTLCPKSHSSVSVPCLWEQPPFLQVIHTLSHACYQASKTSTYNLSVSHLSPPLQSHCHCPQAFRVPPPSFFSNLSHGGCWPTLPKVPPWIGYSPLALQSPKILCLQSKELLDLSLEASQALAQSFLPPFLFCSSLSYTHFSPKNSQLSSESLLLLIPVFADLYPLLVTSFSLVPPTQVPATHQILPFQVPVQMLLLWRLPS